MKYEDKKLRLMGLVTIMKGHNVYTPFELVEQLLEITLDGIRHNVNNYEFAVMFNAEFVLTLREKFNVNPTRITFFGDCDTKKSLAENWNCKYDDAHKLMGKEMTDDTKKFDFVVGNPPYQDTREHGKKITGNGPLWVHFTKLAIERLKQNGTLAYIIPDSVLAPTNDMMGSRISLFNDYFKVRNLKFVNTNIKEHFPDVGINPIALILENNEDYINTIINGKKIDISNMIFFPKDDSNISLSIHKKILNKDNNKHEFKMRWRQQIRLLEKASDVKSEKFVYPVLDHHSYKELRWSEHKDPDFDRAKVMVTRVGKYQCVADKGKCGAKPEVSIRFIEENETLDGVYSFYNSSLIHWVMNTNKWTQFLLPQILNYIPHPKLNREWSDQEIFDHFRLSNRDVTYITDGLKGQE